MLNEYPLCINNEEILITATMKEDWKKIENVTQSEAGTDMVSVVRNKKLTLTLTFKVMSGWLKKFASYRDEPSVTVKRYDAVEEGYTTHTMRFTSFNAEPLRKSWDLQITNGVWKLSITLEEI